ncbi:transposase domain protein [Leptospira alstonii serovar Pingchang str. 80-412]|uniref:Transposase domain protein n=1 Tax=Leptospira alstonii serovar Pingchang str. 80-412 TaxID=1218564 RepID=T0G862_9LEPT|nr:transposase domain protein [Leptospira alstonii serovar Pingchang str. 80-412]
MVFAVGRITNKYLGIDEKSFRRGRKYITVLNDLQRQTVIEVKEGKSKEAVTRVVSSLSVPARLSLSTWILFLKP